MTVHFDTSPFTRSHGTEPRGRGSWAFADNARGDRAVFSPSMTFAEARRWMKAKLAADGVTGTVVVFVQP